MRSARPRSGTPASASTRREGWSSRSASSTAHKSGSSVLASANRPSTGNATMKRSTWRRRARRTLPRGRHAAGGGQPVEPIQHRTAQAVQGGEGQVPFGLQPGHVRHPEPRGGPDGAVQQGGLPRSGLPSDHDRLPFPSLGGPEQPLELLVLVGEADRSIGSTGDAAELEVEVEWPMRVHRQSPPRHCGQAVPRTIAHQVTRVFGASHQPVHPATTIAAYRLASMHGPPSAGSSGHGVRRVDREGRVRRRRRQFRRPDAVEHDVRTLLYDEAPPTRSIPATPINGSPPEVRFISRYWYRAAPPLAEAR